MAGADTEVPTVEALQSQRQAVSEDGSLAEAAQTQAVELLDQAIQTRQQAAQVRQALAAMRQRISTAPARLEAIQAELQTLPEPVEPPAALEPAALEQRIRELERTSNELQAQQAEQAAQLAELLDANKTLGDQLVEYRRRLEQIEANLAAAPPADEATALTQARQAALKVRRLLRKREIELLETQLNNADRLISLATAERDLYAARLNRLKPELQALKQRLQQHREAEAAKARAEAEKAASEAARLPTPLQTIAARNLAYIEELQRITRAEKEVDSKLNLTRARLEEVRQESERLRQRLELVGRTEAMARLLRKRQQSLPSLAGYRRSASERQAEISHATNRQIEVDEQRRALTDLAAQVEQTLTQVDAELNASRQARLRIEARDLLSQQRATLTELYQVYGRYISQLTSLDMAERELLKVAQELEAFIDQQLMWLRSISPLSWQDGEDLLPALAWLTDAEQWAAVLRYGRTQLTTYYPLAMLGVLAWFGLLLLRGRARRGLIDSAAETRRVRTDRFALTGRALGWTLVLAAPVPALFALLSLPLLTGSGRPELAAALGNGLLLATAVLAGLELARQMGREEGLGMRHFRWPDSIRLGLLREARWLRWVAPPLVLLVVVAANSGDPQVVTGLGRPAFILLNLVAMLFLYRLFRVEGPLLKPLRETPGKTRLEQLHFLWFPLLLAVPLALLGLAVLGYQYSAVLLARRLLTTVGFLAVVFGALALLLRWLYIEKRRFRLEEALRRREALHAQREQQETGETTLPMPPAEDAKVDFSELSDQAQRLLSTGLLFGVIVGLWAIWSDLLPALDILNAVKLPMSATETVDGITKTVPVTLADGVVALIVLGVTGLAAKNLPGLLEILLLQRLPLEAGARYAITTLSQYGIVAIGVVSAFTVLGAAWSNIQWLVAALGVGLGFGLQEIVANFVSGLILLFERPVRVGDIVTVGGNSGMVTRIQIRATTIRNWDYQELLVPNKEFITGQVLNWTLTDNINRIVVTVGVAYGSDIPLALRLLDEAASEHARVLKDPEPIITFENFSEHSLTLILRCYIAGLDYRLVTISELHTSIRQKFAAAGVEIAFPQSDVHLDVKHPLPVEWLAR